MMQGHTLFIWYFIAINLVALLVYGWDKLCAKKQWWRVPELTLLALAALHAESVVAGINGVPSVPSPDKKKGPYMSVPYSKALRHVVVGVNDLVRAVFEQELALHGGCCLRHHVLGTQVL